MVNKNNLGYRIKHLREQRNLSLIEMEKKINISSSTLYAYEASTRFPSYDRFLKLAAFFDVSLDYLAGNHSKTSIDLTGLDSQSIDIIYSTVEKFRALNNSNGDN